MRHVCVSFVALVALAGCDTIGKVKSENPVFPPAPPRTSLNNKSSEAKILGQSEGKSSDRKPGADQTDEAPATGKSAVQTASLTKTAEEPEKKPVLDDTEVVATVNGQPIFAGEILERFGSQMAAARKQASPEEFAHLREMLLRRDLPAHVERKILVQNLRATLKPEQVKMLQGHLEKMFDAEIERMKKHMKVSTRADVEQKLAQEGTSLESLRTTFMNQRMAMEYLMAKSKYEKKVGRRELYEYYAAHEKDYSFPEQVKWQQIVVMYEKHGGKEKAYQNHLKKALDALVSGKEFGDVARKYSDGATKTNGGVWDWMPRGSLDDETVEDALFKLPVGKVSEVFVGKKSYQIVKVLDRKEAGVKPFEELQDEIKQKVEQEARKAASEKMLADLKSKALVESPYIDPPKK